MGDLAKLKKRLAGKRGNTSKLSALSKVKSKNVSADPAPWDEDELSTIASEAEDLGVRGYGEDEEADEDELDYEESAKLFKTAMRNVARRVSAKDQPYNSPATQEMVTRETLASILRLLPDAERNYKASGAEKAAYAYTNLTNNARELMSDLRSMSSTDALADKVIHDAVQPAFLQLVSYVITEVSTIRTKLNGASVNSTDALRRQIHEQLNQMLEEIGRYGQETLDKANEKARVSLKG